MSEHGKRERSIESVMSAPSLDIAKDHIARLRAQLRQNQSEKDQLDKIAGTVAALDAASAVRTSELKKATALATGLLIVAVLGFAACAGGGAYFGWRQMIALGGPDAMFVSKAALAALTLAAVMVPATTVAGQALTRAHSDEQQVARDAHALLEAALGPSPSPYDLSVIALLTAAAGPDAAARKRAERAHARAAKAAKRPAITSAADAPRAMARLLASAVKLASADDGAVLPTAEETLTAYSC
jgi:hypothetical protein